MSTFTSNLGLPHLASGGGEQIAAHNEGLTFLDFAVMPTVVNRSNTSPPSPTTGDCFIVKATGSGAWLGKDNNLAYWTGTGWKFLAPDVGWRAWIEEEKSIATFTGSKWHAGVGDANFCGLMTSATAALGNVGVRTNVPWQSQVTDITNSQTFTHSTSTNNHQVTVLEAGVYMVDADLTFNVKAGAVGNRLDGFIQVNGTDVTPCGSSSLPMSATSPTPGTVRLARAVNLAASDVVSLQVCRGSGANTSTIVLSEARVSIRRVQ